VGQFDLQRGAFFLLAAIVLCNLAISWMLMIFCAFSLGECRPAEWGVRQMLNDTLLPVLVLFLFRSNGGARK
jgi:hypothetical protein